MCCSLAHGRLPLLIGHINSRYETVVADLEALGKPPSNDPSSEMMGLVTDFAASIESHIQGGPGHEKLLQDVMAAYMRYKRDLWRTAPRFTPFTAKELDEDEADVQLKMDYAGDVEGVREGPMGPSGQDGKIMDLDDVREHVKRCAILPKSDRRQLISGQSLANCQTTSPFLQRSISSSNSPQSGAGWARDCWLVCARCWSTASRA